MNKGLMASAVCCAVALAGAVTASGATNVLTGNSVGDPNNAVSIKVTVKKGVAKAVKGVKTENYNYVCDDEETTGESSATIPGSFKVKKVDGKYAFSGKTAPGTDPYWRVGGTVNKKGTSAQVEVYYVFKWGSLYCGGNSGAIVEK